MPLPLLANWENFYIIIGAAAATLTGLMFVVVTVMAGIETQISTLNAGLSAFTTPSVVHFCAVLLLAGILSAPWHAFSTISLLLGLSGVGLMIYQIIVVRRMMHIPGYQTPLNDWIWYSILPLISYIVLIFATVVLPGYPELALYIIGAVMFVLLFIGIRNAWDLVTYLAVERSHTENTSQ